MEKTNRNYSLWTKEETNALQRGIEIYGEGSWQKILDDEVFGPILRNRTNVNLKDKNRNLKGAAAAAAPPPPLAAAEAEAGEVEAVAEAVAVAEVVVEIEPVAVAEAVEEAPLVAEAPLAPVAPLAPEAALAPEVVMLPEFPKNNRVKAVYDALVTLGDPSSKSEVFDYLKGIYTLPKNNFRGTIHSKLNALVKKKKVVQSGKGPAARYSVAAPAAEEVAAAPEA